jgi:quinoprotein glucose dehydrogenase
VFDRITGKPVWPIEERAVPQSDVPGEKTAKTQPFPTKPPAYGRNFFNVPDDLIDFTPEMRATAKDQIARYKTGPMFLPPVIGDPAKFLGAINLGNASGGTNWPGAGYDPETQTVYAQANQSAVTPISLRTPPANFSDIKYVSGRNDQEFRVAEGPGYGSAADYLAFNPNARRQTPPAAEPAAGRGAAGGRAGAGRGGAGGGNPLQVQGLSIIKPPYGVVSAVNLNKGTLDWKVPYGETPDVVRQNPALKGLNIGNTGQGGSVGLLVTKTLVVLGDSQVTSIDHPRGAMLRAHDKKTGAQVGAVWMPAPQSGSPMTYSANGRQYIVIAVSGGAYSGEFIAYALPESN